MSPNFTRRTSSVVIYQGDDLQALAESNRAAIIAERRADELRARAEPKEPDGAERYGDGDDIDLVDDEDLTAAEAEAEQARQAHDAFVDEAVQRATVVEIQAIGSRAFQELVAAHPPRTEVVDDETVIVEADRAFRVNTLELPYDLLSYVHAEDPSIRTVVSPQMTRDELRRWLEVDVEFASLEEMWQTAWWANRSRGVDPKATRFGSSTDSPSGAST